VINSADLGTRALQIALGPTNAPPFLTSATASMGFVSHSHPRNLRFQRCYGGLQFTIGISLAVVFASLVSVSGEEPLQKMRAAWVDSSTGLASGSGKGAFRRYESVAGGEWELTVDSEITTHFVGRNYYVELVYNPELRGLKCRRIMKTDRSLRTALFSPGWLARGQMRDIVPENPGKGLAPPSGGEFPWDVSALPLNVWDFDRLFRHVPLKNINVVETSEGDLIGSYQMENDPTRVRFECPKRFGFNIARIHFSDPAVGLPSLEFRMEWKQAESSLWYVRSLQHEWLVRSDKKRIRDVLKYSDFKPNVKVDPNIFTTEYLRMPMGAQEPGERPEIDTK
jgi:hypothetical protein